MTQRIIFKTDDGGVGVIVPSDEAMQKYTMQEIAQKDVPTNAPYKIVPVEDVPSDRSFRDAWEIDETLLTDGVGGVYEMFSDDPFHPDNL